MTINDLRQNPLKQSKLGYMTERRNSENTLHLTAWLKTIALCYHTYPAMERRNEQRRNEKQGVHTLTESNSHIRIIVLHTDYLFLQSPN